MKADDDGCCPVWMGGLSSGWALPGAAGILGLAAPGLLLGLRTQSSERLLFCYFLFFYFYRVTYEQPWQGSGLPSPLCLHSGYRCAQEPVVYGPRTWL